MASPPPSRGVVRRIALPSDEIVLTIISAMQEESLPVRTALATAGYHRPGEQNPSLDFSVVGMGRDGVESGLKGMMRDMRQRQGEGSQTAQLLLLGFAGGLDPSLSTGDLVLASRYCRLVPQPEPLVYSPHVQSMEDLEQLRRRLGAVQGGWAPFEGAGDPVLPRRAVLKSLGPDPGLRQDAKDALTQAGLAAAETDSITVPRPVTDAGDKRELHRRYCVGAVNMEDYWVARLADAAKVPFLSVRAILDTAVQGLPSYLLGFSTLGRVQAVLKALLRPWRLPTLLSLARQMRQAQSSLARFALVFVNYRRGAAPSPPGVAT